MGIVGFPVQTPRCQEMPFGALLFKIENVAALTHFFY